MDFIDLIKRLSKAEVEFVIVGGFAAAVYGCTLLTQDLDICIRFSTENLTRLGQALEGLSPVHRMTANRKPLTCDELKNTNFKNLYLDTDIGILDCLSEITGVGGYETVIENCIRIELEGVAFQTISLESLIQAKEALGRERDIQAVTQLKSLKQIENDNDPSQ